MCLGKGVTPFFFYLFFFTCIRGTSRDLMGRFFCPIGVQRCIASRFSTTSQARLISYQILLLNYFPPSQAGTRPGSLSYAYMLPANEPLFQALKRECGLVAGVLQQKGDRPDDVSSPQAGTRPGSHPRGTWISGCPTSFKPSSGYAAWEPGYMCKQKMCYARFKPSSGYAAWEPPTLNQPVIATSSSFKPSSGNTAI